MERKDTVGDAAGSQDPIMTTGDDEEPQQDQPFIADTGSGIHTDSHLKQRLSDMD